MKRSQPSFSRQKMRILSGQTLKKDREVQSVIGGRLHRYQPSYRKLERTILAELIGKYATHEERSIAKQIAACQECAPCDQWPCYVCRHRYYLPVRDELATISNRLTHSDISFLTLVCGVASDANEAEKIIDSTKARLDKVLQAFNHITARGRFEVDCLFPGDELGTFKKSTLESLGYLGKSTKSLIPHLHAIIVHKGIRRGDIKFSIKSKFKGSRRIRLTINKDKQIERSIDDMLRYTLKFSPPAGAISKERQKVPQSPKPKRLLYYFRIIEQLGGLYGKLSYKHDG